MVRAPKWINVLGGSRWSELVRLERVAATAPVVGRDLRQQRVIRERDPAAGHHSQLGYLSSEIGYLQCPGGLSDLTF